MLLPLALCLAYVWALPFGLALAPPQYVLDQPKTWKTRLSQLSPAQIGNWFDTPQWLKSKSADEDLQLLHSGVTSYTTASDDEFQLWLNQQSETAFERILDNIGGTCISGDSIASGAVIASPSKMHPNYYYQWVRDAAITVRTLIDRLDDQKFNETEYDLPFVVESYIANSYRLQRVTNPSGNFHDLSGLGEPKFLVDSSPFEENWGRPQRDGPALRAITIISYLKVLDKYNKTIASPDLRDSGWIYRHIIKPDLRYIVKYWAEPGFDLWEEVNSLHLFTSLAQLKALKLGLVMAKDYGDLEFSTQLTIAFNALRLFISSDAGFSPGGVPYLIETPSLLVQGKRCGLDIGSIIGTIRCHDLEDKEDAAYIPYPVTDTSVMNTLVALVNDMKYRYPVNHRRLGLKVGVGLGRYPEDIYDGYGTSEGNPWFIATTTAAEVIYQLVYSLYNFNQDLVVTAEQASMWSEITNMDVVSNTVLPHGSEAFVVATNSLFDYADSFMEVVKEHVDAGGHMSEQFDRYTGYLEGAEDLTWSYGAFWTANRWRNKALEIMG